MDHSLHTTLATMFGDRYSTNADVLDLHGRDESSHPSRPPEAVIFAHSTAEVAEIVKLAAASKTPIVPFGVGTSLEGHTNALNGGISIDLSQMDQVLEVNSQDMDCRVQAGVKRVELNDHLRDTGLFFPIDPGANATIGGMTATRASGTNAVKFGTMKDNVIGLTVVTATGDIIETGGRAPKSSAGYDLTRLFIGSEGTLGVITEIQLKLAGQPEAVSAAICSFSTVTDAANTAIMVKQMGIPVARMELVDTASIKALNAHEGMNLREADHLFFEFHGTEAGVQEQAEIVGSIVEENNGGDFEWATKQEDRNRLWKARHNMYYALIKSRPGCRSVTTDVCVPISHLAECIDRVNADVAAHGLRAPVVGHVGDGNFHALFLIDPDDTDEAKRAAEVSGRMVEHAISVGGTCTGEHGVGHGKIKYLEREHGPAAVAMMRTIKKALDPDNIMNPGKVIQIN